MACISILISQINLFPKHSHSTICRGIGTNAVPNEIVVYAGTSNDDLKKIGELKYEDNQLPFADKTWIGRVSEEDLSKLSLYSLKERERLWYDCHSYLVVIRLIVTIV